MRMERECSSYIKYPLIGLVLSFLFPAAVLSAGMNDYDYFKRVSAGTEKLAMPAYKGVPGKTRQEVMQVIKQSCLSTNLHWVNQCAVLVMRMATLGKRRLH